MGHSATPSAVRTTSEYSAQTTRADPGLPVVGFGWGGRIRPSNAGIKIRCFNRLGDSINLFAGPRRRCNRSPTVLVKRMASDAALFQALQRGGQSFVMRSASSSRSNFPRTRRRLSLSCCTGACDIQPLDHTQEPGLRLHATGCRSFRVVLAAKSAILMGRTVYRQVPAENFGGRHLDPGRDHHVPGRRQFEAPAALADAFGEGVALNTNNGTSAPSCSPSAWSCARQPGPQRRLSAISVVGVRTAAPALRPSAALVHRDVGAERPAGAPAAGRAARTTRSEGPRGTPGTSLRRWIAPSVRTAKSIVSPSRAGGTRSAAGGSRRRGGRRRGGRG